MEKIEHIIKEEAKLAARLYITSLFTFHDKFNTDFCDSNSNEFSTEKVNEKIQDEIDILIKGLMKNIDIEAPQTSYECITKAKQIIQKNNNNKTKGLTNA